MKTVSSHVKDLLKSKPVLEEVIRDDLANLSAVARHLKPAIELRTGEIVSEASIIMALHRVQEDLQNNNNSSPNALLSAIKNLTMQSDIIVYNFSKMPSAETIRKLDEAGELLTATKGLWNHALILKRQGESAVDVSKDAFSKAENLSAITFQFKGVNYENIGLYGFILQQVTNLGVPVVEVASSLAEFTIIIKDQYTVEVFDYFYNLLKKD